MSETLLDKVVLRLMNILLIALAIICLLPIILAVSASFSSETAIALNGFSLWPQDVTLDTYRFILSDKLTMIVKAYGVTVFVTAVGTITSVAVTTAYAYAISVRGFKNGDRLAFFSYFTILFSGGMLPWYILSTKYYHLNDTLAGLFLPYLMNVFFMYLQRNYFKSIPIEITESAQIDGAGYFKIFITIMLPLSKVSLVTICLFYAVQYWNDFFLPLMLVSDKDMYTLQYMMYNMLSNISYLATSTNKSILANANVVPPLETAKMAMTCLTIGPIILLFPFLQKYFVKGILIGSVKG
ncbi:carbohydrate ABC transporter permease [Paenibacillus sp. YIM B09110]|uniref:carbohydrate ABC transporter permease n=1 Tax=Paenibacillus sp. YIM B09110 TaxID=3126102 RepID=UPI00301DFCDB